MLNLERVYKIKGDILFKFAKASKHFLRVPPAIAIDWDIYQKYKSSIRYVQVFEEEEKIYYTARVEDFKVFGFWLDRGHGRQVALPLEYWKKTNTEEVGR